MSKKHVLNTAEGVLANIEKQSQRQFLPIVGPVKGGVLARIIREIKPRRILEIGTLVGYSAILMGKELTAEAELVTIEIHADEAEVAKQNILLSHILPTVRVLAGDAKKVIPTLEGRFDMVFIDAEKSEYLQYLCLVEGKLHGGSVIAADNAGIFADEMRDYLDYVRSSGKYRSEYFGFGDDGMEVSVKL